MQNFRYFEIGFYILLTQFFFFILSVYWLGTLKLSKSFRGFHTNMDITNLVRVTSLLPILKCCPSEYCAQALLTYYKTYTDCPKISIKHPLTYIHITIEFYEHQTLLLFYSSRSAFGWKLWVLYSHQKPNLNTLKV